MKTFRAGTVVDQYELVRMIGQGGFGTVWLARSSVLDSYVALKIISGEHTAGAQRELVAVQAYKKLAIGGLASGLIPIEHVGLIEGHVFYVMPLADGMDDVSPLDPAWKPMTLAARMQRQVAQPDWFSSAEIISWFADVCAAAQVLNNAEMVHGDIKPDNIIFIRGRAVISDISLLAWDASQATRFGTPGFIAPSWYLEAGGKPDMFAIAATLFTALTGQSPDRMGRAAFRWPPKGKDSLPVQEQAEWSRLHNVVLRATREVAAERYLTFTEMGEALAKLNMGKRAANQTVAARRPRVWYAAIAGLMLLVLMGWLLWSSEPSMKADEVWKKIVDAYKEGNDLTKAHIYETKKGRRVAEWLFTKDWIDSKLDSKRKIHEDRRGKNFEIRYQVKENGESETVRLVFVRGDDGEWKFDDVFLEDLKGTYFQMYLSEFVFDKNAAEEKLRKRNPGVSNLPLVNFSLN